MAEKQPFSAQRVSERGSGGTGFSCFSGSSASLGPGFSEPSAGFGLFVSEPGVPEPLCLMVSSAGLSAT